MQSLDEPQKYLKLDFYGEYSSAGVPFIDYRCDIYSSNIIIYGHNMRNGTMFSDLTNYLDYSFAEEHKVIEFETIEGVRYFTVTDVLQTDVYDKWYDRIGIEDEKQYLILSTCYGSSRSGRLLIIAAES